MRRLVLTLDSLPALREATSSAELDLSAAVSLAGLAGVDAVRLEIADELFPVGEQDVYDARRAARSFELCMPASQALLKIALEARPDRLVLTAEGQEGAAGAPIDLSGRGPSVGPVVRALVEAGIPVAARIAPDIQAVKAVHGEGVAGVEFYTGSIVDLPGAERSTELVALGDAVRLASKLHLRVGASGGLGYHTLRELLTAAPAVETVAVGRAAAARALLVGLDRAVRDLRRLVDG